MRILIICIILGLAFPLNVFAEKYYAEIASNNVVKRVIVADSLEWCQQTLGGRWVETFSDISNKNRANAGDDYLEIYDDFCAPQPYPSWILNTKRKWVAPIPRPGDGKAYKWDEDTLNWKSIP